MTPKPDNQDKVYFVIEKVGGQLLGDFLHRIKRNIIRDIKIVGGIRNDERPLTNYVIIDTTLRLRKFLEKPLFDQPTECIDFVHGVVLAESNSKKRQMPTESDQIHDK